MTSSTSKKSFILFSMFFFLYLTLAPLLINRNCHLLILYTACKTNMLHITQCNVQIGKGVEYAENPGTDPFIQDLELHHQLPGNEPYPQQVAAINLQDNSLQELFKLTSTEMLKRSEEFTFHEAAEVLLGLATFAEEDLPCWHELQWVCSQMTSTLREAPPLYLCSMFYSITAIDLHKSGHRGKCGTIYLVL